jgi:hypothetical protein
MFFLRWDHRGITLPRGSESTRAAAQIARYVGDMNGK